VLVHGAGHAFGQCVRGLGGDPLDVHAGLGQAAELPAQGVELPGRRDQPATPPGELERRQEPDHQVVRAGAESDLAVRVVEQPPEAGAHLVGSGERAVPLVVDQRRRVVEGLELGVAGDVRPRLVRVAGQQQPFGHPEPGVVRRQGIRRASQVVEPDHSSLRMAHRSGNTGLDRVVRR
jgi:hypothetical protein